VPGISVTIYLSSPINAFIKDDFPALGRPTTAKRGNSCSSTSSLSGKAATSASSKSPVPLPFILAILK